MALMHLEFHPVSNIFGMYVFKENLMFFSEFPLVSVVMAYFSSLIFIYFGLLFSFC